MACTGVRQMSATPVRPAVSGNGRSYHGVDRRLDHEGTLNSERKIEKKAGADQNNFPLNLIVVIEQWISLVLGIVCLVSGIVGIAMNPGQNDLSADFPWSKSMYVPLLRIMAAICLALGIVLVRLGWASPVRTQWKVLYAHH